ncbi:MAG TPA: antibiotic biosynthesis monooxygenase [Bosea sp. (in: a-proteobacteria)]|jgi:heme-degrading monooxygenase HmoA|nr:antibiotic biosynthesis monooxygenase [Bosea sp. (in: a-proteobacteria)]
MVTELALLRLQRGSSLAFEAAFARVAPLLTGADGYLRHRLVPTLDDADLYLLEVEWRDLAAHTLGFEPSDAHALFMAPLEPMLVGAPIVVHVLTGERS